MGALTREEMGETLGPALRRAYAATADSVPLARNALVSVAAAAGAEAEQLDAVGLAASEALTNAVIHAYPGRAGRIYVNAWIAPHEVVVEISDHGRGLQAATDRPGLGVGLGLIAQLSDDFEIRQPQSGGTEVRMCFLLGPERTA